MVKVFAILVQVAKRKIFSSCKFEGTCGEMMWSYSYDSGNPPLHGWSVYVIEDLPHARWYVRCFLPDLMFG